MRALRLNAELPTPVQENIEYPVSLVSSPGFAVLDSGCGKTIVGANALSAFRKIWNDSGIEQPQPLTEENMFRFGNGASELSKESIEMPVCLAERAGTIRAAIVKGDAPRGMKSMFSDDSARVGTYDAFYGYGTVGTVGTVRWVRWVRYGGYAGYGTGGTVGTVRWYGGYGGCDKYAMDAPAWFHAFLPHFYDFSPPVSQCAVGALSRMNLHFSPIYAQGGLGHLNLNLFPLSPTCPPLSLSTPWVLWAA